MKKATHILLVAIPLFIFLSFTFQKNEKIIFHEIEYTASSVELVKWNITDTTSISFVQETIDNLGRTKELRFFNYRHQLAWAGSGFYGGAIIKYDYSENQIIETFFSADNEIANDFSTSEVPYRFIYHLDENQEIIKTEMKFKIDFEWTKESFEQTINHLEFYKQYTTSEGSDLEGVFGYNYAYAKMNEISPKMKEQK